MKKTLSLFVCIIVLILNFCSCGSNKNYDFEYNINDYNFFSDIMDNKTEEEWANLGNYTMLINGLDTPVVLEMEGMKVNTVTAYNKTVEVNIDTYQGYTPAEIQGIEGAVIVNENLDYSNRSWIITKENIHTFNPKDNISTRIFVDKEGNLQYTRYWGEYMTSFNQWDTAPLDLCKSRDEFLYQKGTVRIETEKIFLSPEKTVNVSDEYDLDSLFEDAKKNGMYEEYNTADEVLSNNADSE